MSTISNGETWMVELIQQKPEASNWKLSEFHLPGTHNSCTYGAGSWPHIAEINWRCQNKTLSEQLACGVRYFDVRLGLEDDYQWWPCHGIAYKTGDVLSTHVGADHGHADDPQKTLVGQLRRFIDTHPREIVIISVSPNTGQGADKLWGDWINAFEDVLIPLSGNETVPTYSGVIAERQSLLLVSDKMTARAPVQPSLKEKWFQYIWPSKDSEIQRERILFLDGPYTDKGWQQSDPGVIRELNEAFMKNEPHVAKRDRLWSAQCQLTPSFGSDDYWKDPTFSPEELAKIANPYILRELVPDEFWKSNSNIITFDFADEALALAVARMNI